MNDLVVPVKFIIQINDGIIGGFVIERYDTHNPELKETIYKNYNKMTGYVATTNEFLLIMNRLRLNFKLIAVDCSTNNRKAEYSCNLHFGGSNE